MKSLIVYEKNGKFTVTYELEDIKRIEVGKAKDYYSKSDLEGNGIKPYEPMFIIMFFDNTVASFSGNDCAMYYI